LFVVGSALCALSPNAELLIAARALQGAAAALVAPLSLSLLGAAFGPARRAWALGVYSGITGLAVLGGPVVGGAVTQGLGWQWVFWINVPIGLAAIPLVLTRMQESHGPRARVDGLGLVLVSAAALGIVWGLMRGNNAGWGSLEVVSTLAAGAVLTLAFLAWERRVAAPMLPLGLFASRGFSAGNAANFLLSACLFSAVFFMALMTARQLGGVFGVAIGAAVFTGAGIYASAAAFGDGFGPALGVAAAFSLVGAACAAGKPVAMPWPRSTDKSTGCLTT
jgi:MFS family permease